MEYIGDETKYILNLGQKILLFIDKNIYFFNCIIFNIQY